MNTTSTPPRSSRSSTTAGPSSVSTAPAPARTDLDHHAARTADGAEATATGAAGIRPATVRRHALPLVLGALAWSVSSFALGFNPSSSVGIVVQDLSGLAFQVGVMSLVLLQLRTAATGTGRGARIMLRVEQVLLSLAMAWTLVHALVPSARDDAWLAVLDMFWPLSMLGMFIIAVKIAVAGRWRGLARYWPLVAESWAVVSVPSVLIGGDVLGKYVGSTHLLIGYVTLGLILMARPHLVGAQD